MFYDSWKKFNEGSWENNINVREFIQNNYTPYYGDHSFLKESTEKTKRSLETMRNINSRRNKKRNIRCRFR